MVPASGSYIQQGYVVINPQNAYLVHQFFSLTSQLLVCSYTPQLLPPPEKPAKTPFSVSHWWTA